jgi:hypothetical protein
MNKKLLNLLKSPQEGDKGIKIGDKPILVIIYM